MKDWKDVPHLFANGKFLCGLSGFINLRIEMYDGLTNMYCLSDVHGWHKVNDCTLIARKIEDMTEEEHNHHQQIIYTIRNDVQGAVAFRGESVESFLYLLSIGVYPFDQSHFESGIVIDMKTLK